MPRQNRVNPYGELIAVPDRGRWMGNRGILHDDDGRLTEKRWKLKAWIICQTEFKGRKRPLMLPNHYTELFFLDEATALSAGHRPCGECRRADYLRFKRAWQEGNAQPEASIDHIDKAIHAERVRGQREKVTYSAPIDSLPDGTMIDPDGQPWLIWRGQFHRWTPGGYDQHVAIPQSAIVAVLTPRSTVNAIRAGYVPQAAL